MMPTKDPSETVTIEFDFGGEMSASIQSATVTATVHSGTDASPSAVLSGASQIVGSSVTQKVTGGVSGVIYKLKCVASSPNETLVRSGLLPVKTLAETR